METVLINAETSASAKVMRSDLMIDNGAGVAEPQSRGRAPHERVFFPGCYRVEKRAVMTCLNSEPIQACGVITPRRCA